MTTQPGDAIPVTVPAPHDLITSWPEQPQQLFLLFHGAGQKPSDMLDMAQRLSRQFPQGVVACVAAPHAYDEGEGFQWYSHRGESDENRAERLLPARLELSATVRAWQRHTGLGPERTALLCFAQSATVALEAVAAEQDLAARLFAVAGRFDRLPEQMHQHTCIHWMHGKDDEVMPYQAAVEAGYRLRDLDADFSVDVFPETGHCVTEEMEQRIFHLLANHAPLRLWRQAMAEAGQPDTPPPSSLH